MKNILIPFAFLLGNILKIRNLLYDKGIFPARNAGIPTISIGNLSVGGTGKTPAAEMILTFLLEKGFYPAYLSRGYGRKTSGFLAVKTASAKAENHGEEACQIAHKFPEIAVAVCEKRVEGARKLLTIYPKLTHLVLDDAFQHRAIYRDCEIVVIDAQRLPYEDALMPAGRLREPLSALLRADIVFINKLRNKNAIPEIKKRLSPYASPDVVFVFAQPVLQAAKNFFTQAEIPLEQAEAVVFSGIGNPDFFALQLAEKGVQIKEKFAFADHHFYTEKDINLLLEAHSKHKNAVLLTTEKDYFRLRESPLIHLLGNTNCLYVPMKLQILEGEKAMKTRILHACERR